MGFPSPAALRHDGAGTSREAAMMRARAYVATALAIALAAALAPAAVAQPYPNRPVRLIVPFPPGGPADVMARLIAQPLSATLGPIVVENRPGAGGTLAGKGVAIADPDGYTLLLGSSAALAIGPALYGNAGYDPIKSFVPVALVSDVPYVMVGAVNAPFRTAQELLAYARANPGKLTFGVPNGAPPHALALSFRALTGIDAVIVPYRGASTLITDMLAGRIHAGFETTSVMFGHLHDGKIRGLAFIQPRRHPDIPDVPTIGEAGVPDLVGSSWIGIVAPAGTPPEIVGKLREHVHEALKSPEMLERMKKLGAEVKLLSQDEFAAFIAAEHQRLGTLIRASGVKVE
jgi:tripartite-type tricarboxylate transporter receptor subunit TctC